jgi:hypothetical protein
MGHLGDIGVLAEAASKIASHRCNGVRAASWHQMEYGLFLDGIHVPGNEPVKDQGFQNTVTVFAHPAYPALSRFNRACVVAQVAAHIPLFKFIVKVSFHLGFQHVNADLVFLGR